MPQSLLGHIFRLPPILRKKAPLRCETIWLFGSGQYAVDAAGVARQQSHLQRLLAGYPPHNSSRLMLASLRARRCESRQRPVADIVVAGQLVGYCPSHLSTRLAEWLDQWKLQEAEVWCSVRLARGNANDGGPASVSAHLDIDLPFRMKTLEFPDD